MIEQIIQKCSSIKLREDALSNEEIKLDDLIRMGRMQETVKKQASIMSKTVQKREEYSEINKITRKPTVREFNKNKNSNNHNKFNKDSSYVSKQKCYNCG